MQLQIPESELTNYKSRDLIPLKCEHCQKIYYKSKKDVLYAINRDRHASCKYCSQKCNGQHKNLLQNVLVKCLNCSKSFYKYLNQIQKNPKHFCNRSCACIYRNQHKKYGYHRSKFEIYLEENLKKEFPTLDIIFNDRQTIGYELDIYIPSKQLAFEINGIFHYKPIYKGYQRTVEIDQLKQKLCQEKHIQLCVFDISKMRHFKPEIGNYYFQLIKETLLLKYGLNVQPIG